MAKTLTIGDGTSSVNLLADPGFDVAEWVMGTPDLRPIQTAGMGDGRGLRYLTRDNVMEGMKLKFSASSHDDAACKLRTLHLLLNAAAERHTTSWRSGSPVYITAQTTNETGARYGLLYYGWLKPGHSNIGQAFRQNVWPDMVLGFEREPYWRDGIPGTSPAAGISMTNVEQTSAASSIFFSNHESASSTITHIFIEDASASTFGANQVATASGFNLFPATPAVNDAIYFGTTGSGPLFDILVNLGTIGVGSYTTIAEYSSSGTAFVEIAGTLDEWNTTGVPYAKINHIGASDHAKQTVNSVSAWWVRVRISSFTDMSTIPAQAAETIKALQTPYVEYAAGQVKGDAPALARMVLDYARYGSGASLGVSRVICGLKSRGFSTFKSHLNATLFTAGSGASKATDGRAADGSAITISTFTTAFVSQSTYAPGAAFWSDFAGTYAVYLRGRQIGGAAGDISVRLDMTTNTVDVSNAIIWQGNEGIFNSVDAENGVVFLGELQYPPLGVDEAETGVSTQTFALKVKRMTGSATLRWYDLIFIPTDEMAFSLVWSSTQPILTKREMLIADAGVKRRGVYALHSLGSSGVQPGAPKLWQGRGSDPLLPPQRRARLYFLTVQDDTNLYAEPGLGMRVVVAVHNRYHTLRGAG